MGSRVEEIQNRSTMRYWIDWIGRLWKGPVAPDDNMHYATFWGYVDHPPHEEIWVIERSAEPEDADEITAEQSDRAKTLYKKGA